MRGPLPVSTLGRNGAALRVESNQETALALAESPEAVEVNNGNARILSIAMRRRAS
jgi:hypothetical protein